MPTRAPLEPATVRRVLRRSHGLRTLGLALGAVMIASVLYRQQAPAWAWSMLVAHGLAWPHLVRILLHHSRQPLVADERCFMLDTAMCGAWMALMQFNLLPCVALVTTCSMALISIGGTALLVRGLALMALTCAVAAGASGWAFAPASGMVEMLAAVPLLVVFPATLSIILHRLSQRVRRQNRTLLRMSSTDCLSGLLNRSYWEDAVNATIARRPVAGAALLLIDVDHFKRVNDQHGHAAGDEVVRTVGAIIRRNLRSGDVAGRYGGDEFAVMLDGTDAMAAGRVAERVREGIACSLLESIPGLHCTVSIGIAELGSNIGNAGDWLKEADAALYRAKLAGRNRFALAG